MPAQRGDTISRDDLVAFVLEAVYPIGAIYISENNTSPATLFGGTWEQITDTFLLAAGSSYTAASTGGAASVSYTPAGSVQNHKLTTSEMPKHSHGLNSHKHSYTYPTGSTGGNNGNTGSTTINFSNGYADICAGSRYIDFRFKSKGFNSTNGVEVGSNYYATTSYHGTAVELGGSQDHTHTLNNHTHTVNTGSTDTGAASGNTAESGSDGNHNHGFSGTAATINTMPPYLTVYMWKRVA